MTRNITEDDEGKDVVDSNGETIGIVSSVRAGTAYVDPDPGLTDSIKSKLGWNEPDTDDYPLDDSRVDTVTDEEVRLSM